MNSLSNTFKNSFEKNAGFKNKIFSTVSKLFSTPKSKQLTKIIAKRKPKSLWQQKMDKVKFGADNIIYSPDSSKIPKIPKKVKDTVIHEQDWHADVATGTRNIGSTKDKAIKGLSGSKRKDLSLTKSIGGVGDTRTINTSRAHRGKKGLAKLHKSFKGENYMLKPSGGFDSGVGGASFVNANDVSKFLSGKKLNAKKTKSIIEFMKKPNQFTAQADLKIQKDIFGQGKEFRVHAVGKKVLTGASSPRSSNITGMFSGDMGKAEKFLQSKLNKLPKKYKDMGIAADVAKTKDGSFKLVELNAGSMASGFLDPEHMKSRAGFLGGLEAVRKNLNVYKQLTGRSHIAEKAVKGTAALGAVGTGVAIHSKVKKKEGPKPLS